MPARQDDLKAVAHLPGLDIEIRRRREEESEVLTIALRAAPSFEGVFGRLEAASPADFWMRAVAAAWTPWLGLWGLSPRLAPPPGAPRLARKPG